MKDIENFLNLNSYKYNIVNSNVFEVDLGNNLFVNIEHLQNKLIIKKKLKGFNWLTGSIPMSIESSLIYNSVLLIILFVLIVLLELFALLSLNVIFPVIFFTLLIIWYLFYFYKLVLFEIKLEIYLNK